MPKKVVILNAVPRRGTLLLEHYRGGELIAFRGLAFRSDLKGSPNLVTNAGKAVFANLFIGSGTAPTHIALGTGTTAAAAGDTALETEIYRESATRSRVTITVTDDTSQYTYTFDIDATYSLTEAGLFNASSGGTLFCHQVYTALPVIADDTLKATWRLQH